MRNLSRSALALLAFPKSALPLRAIRKSHRPTAMQVVCATRTSYLFLVHTLRKALALEADRVDLLMEIGSCRELLVKEATFDTAP
mmetsp:Transcript_2508/g.4279  ORF Transcript_2508/g.4279 Transcript_2508/m.4279 type:complete len:85 (+) Transcript_2508:323-577(+)